METKVPDADRYVCTAATPWTPEKGKRAMHPDAAYVYDREYGNGETTAVYKCPHCSKTFEVELPQ